MGNISIVIGSWGSYNECNERALGSKWLDLSDYESFEEIEKELINEGFKLNEIDEELFIQDIDGIDDNSCNWDYVHPKDLFEILKEADVLDNNYKYDLMCAFLEIRTFQEFRNYVEDKGSHWDDDIHYYKGYNWEDYGRDYFDNCCYKVPSEIENFIDFESYGKYIGEYYAEEINSGIIEICR